MVGTREGGVESPLLYTVFVCDIISRLDRVDIGEDRVYLAGKEFRALQLADDLALIARSPEALQKLIDEWQLFCDDNLAETQTTKTEVCVFTTADDSQVLVINESFTQRISFGRKTWVDIWSHLSYKGAPLKVVESFKYLGALSGSRMQAAHGVTGRTRALKRLEPFFVLWCLSRSCRFVESLKLRMLLWAGLICTLVNYGRHSFRGAAPPPAPASVDRFWLG